MSQPVAFTVTKAGLPPDGDRPTMQRAFLELCNPPTALGSLKAGSPYDRINFDFNPKELSVSKAAKWSRTPQKKSKSSGVPQFEGSEPCKLTLEVFLDASDIQDDSVVKNVEKLFSCCLPTPDSQDKPKPPWVIFHWGSLTSFTGYVTSVNAKYTLFMQGGLPIRATATVALEEITKVQPGQNPTSGALSSSRVHTVLTGDTLASIAWREYGDPELWRGIAIANRIDDPMRLRAGSSVLIPSAEDLHDLAE